MTTMIATCSVENKNIHVSDSVKETTSYICRLFCPYAGDNLYMSVFPASCSSQE